MAGLSLREAAEQAGTSKVDIWRAIQEGTLPAQRTDDGGFAVDSSELFRVFERQRSEERPAGMDATVLPEAMGEPEASATSETAATNDIAVAFAALGAELRGLLGQVAEVGATDELHEVTGANRLQEQLDVIGDKVTNPADEAATEMEAANALIAESEAPIPAPMNEKVAETPPKQPWWRRLVG